MIKKHPKKKNNHHQQNPQPKSAAVAKRQTTPTTTTTTRLTWRRPPWWRRRRAHSRGRWSRWQTSAAAKRPGSNPCPLQPLWDPVVPPFPGGQKGRAPCGGCRPGSRPSCPHPWSSCSDLWSCCPHPWSTWGVQTVGSCVRSCNSFHVSFCFFVLSLSVCVSVCLSVWFCMLYGSYRKWVVFLSLRPLRCAVGTQSSTMNSLCWLCDELRSEKAADRQSFAFSAIGFQSLISAYHWEMPAHFTVTCCWHLPPLSCRAENGREPISMTTVT